ncbi:hypothetical protein A7U60_g8386 [Sanghuangporus baumii]|uniref:Uncharacterized protein n=1 Tax=Sanghuangporus baumii TaxID=108892 RepID=A0A9Q5HR03_SANBA|nr:hypothetical protein A7U60_g8386 [Sanghuangporus baumii]
MLTSDKLDIAYRCNMASLNLLVIHCAGLALGPIRGLAPEESPQDLLTFPIHTAALGKAPFGASTSLSIPWPTHSQSARIYFIWLYISDARMVDKPAHYPLGSSSALLRQQEHQLRQYTFAAISARERERVRASPEPHLEIMRPVSPFQNKRPLAHQVAQTQETHQSHRQRDQRIWNPHYQTHSSSQPYAHSRPFHTQESSHSSTSSGSHAARSGARARINAHREDQRSARSTQRDADISPALKMMNYDTGYAPSSSDQGQGQISSNAPNASGMLAPPDRSDMSRSTSPEGGLKRRNPGWRKPVPKYIPTPPSTPPTTTFERIPSARGREEPLPPVPSSSSSNQSQNVQSERLYPGSVRARAEPAPVSHHQPTPARPARAATELQVPVMFRDLTSAKTRIGSLQQPAQAHTRQNAMSGLSRVTATPTRNLTRPTPSSRVENASKNQAQVSTAPQAPPQAHTTLHDRIAPAAVVRSARPPSPEQVDERTEARQGMLVHPQPRKVPSMAQLVAMVLPTRSRSRSPSRTPSPGVPLTTADISSPIPLTSAVVAETSNVKSPVTLQAATPNLSVDPPSPVTTVEVVKATALPGSLLHPDQVQLPPSGSSSVKTSPSVSPQPSPRAVPTLLPTRSRSPTPAIIPQYAPPPPPFPPPPPNTPTAVPKPRMSSLLQPLLSSKLAEKIETTATQVEEARTQAVPHAQASAEETLVPEADTKQFSSPEHSVSRTTRRARKKRVPPEQIIADSAKDDIPASRQTDDTRTRTGQWSMMITEQRSPSPMRKDMTASQETDPAAMNGTTGNDRMKEVSSIAAVREYTSSSRNLTPSTRPYVKEVESVANEYADISVPPRVQTPPRRELEQARPPAKEPVIPSEKEQSSVNHTNDLKPKSSEFATAVTQPSVQGEVRARPRPVPVPMNEHAQVSRQSGLVTPPDTPPGTVASKPNIIDEEAWSGSHDNVYAAQNFDTDAKPIPRLQSSEPVSEVKPSVSKSLMRRKTLIQDEQPSSGDDRPVKEAGNTSRPASPISSIDKPTTLVAAIQHETVTPPSKQLPNDWKATITNATSSNINLCPSPPIPTMEEIDRKLNVLPRLKPTAHAQTAQTTDMPTASKYVFRGVSTEQVEHATMELELHIHEVETRRVFEASQLSEKTLVADKGNHIQPSRSPGSKVTDLDSSSTAILTVKHEHIHDFAPISNTLGLAPREEPARSRSPIPRSAAPQKDNTDTSVVQERTDESSIVTTTPEDAAVSFSASVDSPVRRPAEVFARSHSSGSKRKGRATRAQELEIRSAKPGRFADHSPDNEVRHRNPEAPVVKDTSPAPIEPESLPKLSSPSQRYQTLGGMKRLPLNGSESNLTQSRLKDSGRDGLSSPQIAARSLPSSTQAQSPPRPPRHLHGQHKRLPAPEVTQAYRPPTPPIPSHYKKKSSNDLLPAEPPTFMKPAVHVIYPDTSTSHGHSLSGDSALNMRPTNIMNRGQPNPSINSQPYKDDRVRPQSPSLTIPTIDDDDDTAADTYPQVPPKARRHEVNTNGSSVPSDRPADFAIQHATRGQVRYPSAPVGQAKAHILMLPPSSNSSRSRTGDNMDGSFGTNPRSRNGQQPRAKKAARSHSEKVFRKNDNVHPLARSRSTPIPSSRQRSRRGFWRIFGLWARVFMSKFRTWRSPTPSPSQSSEYGGYYDVY